MSATQDTAARRPTVGPAPRPRRGRADPRAARQSSLREHNLSLVLRHIIEAPAPTTRARIAGAVGLTRATVSDLVDRLLRGQLVVELETESVDRAGRPGVLLAPASRSVVGLGLEIQVDQISVRATDLAGSSIVQSRAAGDFRASDPAETVERLVRLAAPVVGQLADEGIVVAGACVSVPGIMQRGSGQVRLAPNLGWEGVQLTDLLRVHHPFDLIPVELGNDADLAARAEARARAQLRGTSRAAQSFLYLAGEVGIGGAIVLDGELASGQHGWSGEIGHAVIDPDGPRCRCGATGCLEQFAGKDALLRGAGLDVAEPLRRLVTAAHMRDPRALRSIEAASTALGMAIATAMNIIDVEQVVLGGIYASLYEHLRPGIEAQVRLRVLAARWSDVRVEAALGQGDSALVGASLQVLDRVVTDPTDWVPSS
ncbi:MAG TPA: ROK family protein [Intrasporangium sp.]|uniref:ROK family protein n=1 Tax=Intrasporangium sp. TaxID=1925024 RepID=UPI002D7A2FF5|nr:ROK family protein [Intrasporangium sp.]HET7398273.1 ROK family protein [Intrasporangium sp.]